MIVEAFGKLMTFDFCAKASVVSVTSDESRIVFTV